MCLLFLSEADPLGSGARSCGYRQGGGVFWHDGLASVWESARLLARKIKDVIARRRDRRGCV